MEVINSSRLWNKKKKLGLSGYTEKGPQTQIGALSDTPSQQAFPPPLGLGSPALLYPTLGDKTGVGFLFNTVRLESEELEDKCDKMCQGGQLSEGPFPFRRGFAESQPHSPALPSSQQTGKRTTRVQPCESCTSALPFHHPLRTLSPAPGTSDTSSSYSILLVLSFIPFELTFWKRLCSDIEF